MKKDKSLIGRAIREQVEQSPLRLPSNFAYRVEQRLRERQQRRERREQVAAVAVLVAFVAGSLATLVYLLGPYLLRLFVQVFAAEGSTTSVVSTFFCLTFFAVLNEILRRQYSRRWD